MANENKCKLLNKIVEHICKSQSTVMVLWTENKNPVGNIGRIEAYDFEGNMVINLFDKDLLPKKDKCVIIRNCLFTRPIRGTVENIEENMVVVKEYEFVMVEHEKRRFLRVFLEKPINGRINIGMIDFNIRIFDLSEEGVGFFAVCERDLTKFYDSNISLSFLLDNKNYMNFSGKFAWLSKYGYNKYIGGIHIRPTIEQRYIILHFLTNYMYKVEENLLKILEGS